MINSFFSLRIVATIVACLAITSIHGQHIPDEYVGTWEFSNEDGASSTTITMDALYDQSFYSGTTTYRLTGWFVTDNPDPASKSRFPKGHKLELVLVSGDVNPATIGNTFIRYFFIGTDKNKAIFGWEGPQGSIVVNENIVFNRVITEEPKVREEPKVKEEKTIRREFTTPGNHSFVFNEGFPASVEVFIFGAGGGGQGGHSKDYQQGVGKRTERGYGGGGGGGAAVYARFNVTNATTFNITVGTGGAGGKGISKPVGGSWESGSPGTAGGSTTVRFGSSTLTAGGGGGGGKPGAQNNDGGIGGQPGQAPQGLLEIFTDNGKEGDKGRHNNENFGEGAYGGHSGTIMKYFMRGDGGSNARAAKFGGGGGGTHGNKAGGTGGHGQVIFIIKY